MAQARRSGLRPGLARGRTRSGCSGVVGALSAAGVAAVKVDTQSRWIGGLAEWTDEGDAYLSVAFTWKLKEARERALWYRALGYRVFAGGPATFRPRGYLDDVAKVGADFPDAIRHHHPQATIASRGCPVGCWFCIVPAMEGARFTFLPDFPVRPILCDNNLSALPAAYQDHIVERYRLAGVPLLDANSGFEPRTFDGGVCERWKPILRGPWRFAYDDLAEREDVRRVMRMLSEEPPKRKRVYVLIGNEPVEECLGRIREVIEWGGEPHCQPLMKLNAMEKTPWVRFDWSRQTLIDMARWANRRVWRYSTFGEYRLGMKSANRASPDQAALL